VRDLLPEDLEALGFTEERIMAIELGSKPPPPLPGLLWTHRKPGDPLPPDDPRKGMPLEKQRLYVAPGEAILIDFERGQGSTEIMERYQISFPSGFKTDEIDVGETIRFFRELGYTYEQAVDVTKMAQSNHHTALWPNEGIQRVIVRGQTGTIYYA
jgi:hypothetical protein